MSLRRWTNDKQQSMKERIQQYESLLNADTDAVGAACSAYQLVLTYGYDADSGDER